MTRSNALLLAFFCIIKLGLHLLADFNSGFQGDELLHIEAGNNLAFGYMEFPPLIGLIAFIQNLFSSDSVFVHHMFAHLASVTIMVYVAKTVILFGGKNRALALALLAVIIAPGFGRSQQLFQPVVFSQLFWIIGFYYFASFCKDLQNKHLWYLTLFVILGFLSKYDSLFFIAGLTSLFFFRRTRMALVEQKFWLNLVVFAIAITPNIVWQVLNYFPFVKMMSRLKETQLDELDMVGVLSKLLVSINPINSLFIIIPALLLLFVNSGKYFRPIVISIAISFFALLLNHGKAYYFFPIILTLIPFGALFWERIVFVRYKFVFYILLPIFLCSSLLIPFGMPVYSLQDYIAHVYPYEKQKVEGGEQAVRYEEYYSAEKWHKTLTALKSVYDSLPAKEKSTAMIWGKHYSQAGIVKLKGANYQLPEAFSLHGSFYTWAPSKGRMPETVIAFRESKPEGKNFFEPYFAEVIPVKTIYNPYAKQTDELYQTIFICKYPKQNFEGLKYQFAHRIFE